MAGTITHEWTGTILTITSDSGTSSCDLKGGKGNTGPRGAQGPAGVIVNPDGTIDTSQYATETYVDQKIAEIQGGSVDLSNYYTKPETVSLLNNYATKTYVQEQISNIEAGSVDLTNYYTKAQVDAKIPDTTGLASKTWVEGKGYLTKHQPLKTINGESIVGTGNIKISGGSADMSNYYTKEQIDDKGYLTEHQSLDAYALKTEIPSTTDFATKTELSAKQDALTAGTGIKIENGVISVSLTNTNWVSF